MYQDRFGPSKPECVRHESNELVYLRSIFHGFCSYKPIDEDLLNTIVASLIQFERPDIVSIVNCELYAIEHFEFDFYRNNKKGSTYKKEEETKERLFEQSIKNNEETEIIGQVESKASTDSFISNFLRSFCNHYGKIEDYSRHLLECFNFKTLNIWFIAEIASPMACIGITEKGAEKIHPLMFKTVYETMKDCNLLDGIIFVNEGSFLIVPKRDYQLACRNYNPNDVQLVLTNPQQIRGTYKIELD